MSYSEEDLMHFAIWPLRIHHNSAENTFQRVLRVHNSVFQR